MHRSLVFAMLAGCSSSAGSTLPLDGGPSRDAVAAPPSSSAPAGPATSGPLDAGPGIGPAGGEVRSADGKVVVSIPAGALTRNYDFSVVPFEASAPQDGYAVPGYRIRPSGITLEVPATVRIYGIKPRGFNSGFVTGNGQPDETRTWERLEDVRVGEDWVEGKTRHFSGVRAGLTLSQCAQDSDCPAHSACYSHGSYAECTIDWVPQ